MKVTALIPVHNEEATIEAAVAHAKAECDRVIVISDNSTDRTYELARKAGAFAIETHGNTAKKAGALNSWFNIVLPTAADDSYFLVIDANSRLAPGFVAAALGRFADLQVGGVGGLFHGNPGIATMLPVRVLRELAEERGRVYDDEV